MDDSFLRGGGPFCLLLVGVWKRCDGREVHRRLILSL